MSYNVVVTDGFKREAKKLVKKYKSLANEINTLIEQLEENPTMGTGLGNDCYKIRLAIKSKNKGKSGGARVITMAQIIDEKVIMLTIYDKSVKNDISKKELSGILKEL